MTALHVVVIEWQTTGEDPSVHTATHEFLALREAARELHGWATGKGPMTPDALGDPELKEWLAEDGETEPEWSDPASVRKWLDGFREATTAPWWSLHVTELIEPTLAERPTKEYDHAARPDDFSEYGDRCRFCGDDITWIGPSHSDWLHVDDPANR